MVTRLLWSFLCFTKTDDKWKETFGHAPGLVDLCEVGL